MSETKTLKIFEPLKTYFEILCTANPDTKCTNYDDCSELINILTREDCNPEGNFTKNFLDALSWFAKELKLADSPIGYYTIKNKLQFIFNNVGVEGIKGDELVRKITEIVNRTDDLSGFKMTNDNGEGETYENILKNVVMSKSDKTANELFQIWLDDAFSLYVINKRYFNENIKNIILSDKFDLCQKSLLNKYFKIVIGDEKISVDEYIKNKEKYVSKDARLNVETNEDKTEALIVNILPKNVREIFNKYLISPQKEGEPVFYEESECVKVKLASKTDEVKFEPADKEEVLKWFANFGLEVIKNKRSKPEEINEPDNNSDDPYYDSDADATPYKWPEDFQIVNFTDKWRLDKSGKLWKLNEKTNKFEEYTENDKDSKKFGEKEGHCGNLCIFKDPVECNKFFGDMMKGESYNVDKLSETINRGDFVQSYKSLKENITEVNPLFVIGTLKLFGFQKFTKIDSNGNKIVKIESFTNWWNRQNREKKLSERLDGSKVSPLPGMTDAFPGVREDVDPPAPANLELFFKLLIAFINNNEFILNPKDKKLINKKGKPVYKEFGPEKEFIWFKGKQIKNPSYKKEYDSFEGSKTENLSDLVQLMKKNSYTSKSFITNSPENILNLNTLLGLMVGITNGGKIRLNKLPAYSTGVGYVNIFGGSVDKKIDYMGMLQCAKNAAEIFNIGIKNLDKKNKKLDDKLKKELIDKMRELDQVEREVTDKLKVLTQYVKIINILGDDKDEIVNCDIMRDAIEKYSKSSSKLSKKSDETIISLVKNLFDDKPIGPTSYFTSI